MDTWMDVLVVCYFFKVCLQLRKMHCLIQSSQRWCLLLVFPGVWVLWAHLFSCDQALMTASAELSQEGNHAERHWENSQWQLLRAPGRVAVAENKEESKWLGGRQRLVSSCASSVAHLGLSVVLWSGARLSCCHRGQTPLIRLASTLQAAEIQRKGTAERSKKGTKRGTEALWSFYLLSLCVCVRVCVCAHMCTGSKSPTCYDHTLYNVCVCFLGSRSEGGGVWNRVSLLLIPPSLVSTDSSLLHVTICLSTTTSTRPSLSQTVTLLSPISHSFLQVSLSVSLSLSRPSCMSSSLFLLLSHFSSPLCFSSSCSRGQLCVIKSMVALVVRQLCLPDGQIKNWFLRLIPCTGWMLLPSSLP